MVWFEPFQEFRLLHYAGDVTYCVRGFLDKNNDLLFRDLKEVLLTKTLNTYIIKYKCDTVVHHAYSEQVGIAQKRCRCLREIACVIAID